MGITDASGTVVTTSVIGAVPTNLADKEYFQVNASAGADAPDRLFISKPMMGRMTHRLSVQFTRRIANPDGSFAGVVIASFDPLVLNSFQRASQIAGGFTMLIGFDGVIRAAEPHTATIGDVFRERTSSKNSRDLGGVVAAPDHSITVLNKSAIIDYRKVPGYDLIVAAGFPRHVVFAAYDAGRRNTLFVGAALSLIVVFIGAITMHHRRRLAQFHRALTLTMDNVSQGILMIDKRQRMPVANQRVAELPGICPRHWSARGRISTRSLTGRRRMRSSAKTGTATIADIDMERRARGSEPRLVVYERTRPNGTVLEIRTTLCWTGPRCGPLPTSPSGNGANVNSRRHGTRPRPVPARAASSSRS